MCLPSRSCLSRFLGKRQPPVDLEVDDLDKTNQDDAETLHTILVLASYKTKWLADDTAKTVANYKEDSEQISRKAVDRRKGQATAWAWIRLLLTAVLVLLSGFHPAIPPASPAAALRKQAAKEVSADVALGRNWKSPCRRSTTNAIRSRNTCTARRL